MEILLVLFIWLTASNDNIITETIPIQILNFNDTPVLPTVDIAFGRDGTEDTVFTFDAADLLNGVTDPDFTYDANGNYLDNPFDDILTFERYLRVWEYFHRA